MRFGRLMCFMQSLRPHFLCRYCDRKSARSPPKPIASVVSSHSKKKKKMKHIALALFFSITFQGIACNCMPPEKLNVAQKREIENSNFIIIGNVIKISKDKHNLTVVIKEVFKGENLSNDTIVIKNNYYCE